MEKMYNIQLSEKEVDTLCEMLLENKQEKVNCNAKPKANHVPEYKECTCHNFCKYDNIQFDSILA